MSYADEWEIFVVNDPKGAYAKLFYYVRGIWNVNSGITKIEREGDNYNIFGVSGSCYSCAAANYGIPESMRQGVYSRIAVTKDVEFLKDSPNWENFSILLSQDFSA